VADNSKGKQSRFDLIIGAVDKFSNVFKGFNDQVEGATADLARMQKAVATLNRVTGLSRLSGAVSGVAGSMKSVVNEGKNLVSTVTGLAGKLSALLGVGGAGAMALAKGTANAAAAVGKLSGQAGMGVTLFQEYAHAASQVGISNEEIAGSIARVRETTIKAFRGDVQSMSVLRLAGINPKTAKGEIKSADSIFLELADKVQKLQLAGKNLQAEDLLKGFFGDDGIKFLPMLKNGANGLLEARKEAAKYGMFSEKDAKNADAFNVSLANAWKSIKGIGFSLGTPLLAPLTKLMDKFTEWGLKQKDIISGDFTNWVEGLDIDTIWKSIESGINTLGDLAKTVNGLAQAFGGWKNVLIALAAMISGKFLLSIGSLIASFGKLAFAIMTTPAGWFIAACAAIGAAVYAIYKNWDKIVSYFQNLWQGVKDAFSRNWMEGIVKSLWDFNPLRLILKGMNELIAYFTGINLMEYGAKIIGSLGTGISAAWQSLMDWFMGKLKWFTDKWNKVKSFFGYGNDEGAGVSTNDAGGGWQSSGMGAPLNMGGDVRGVAETRSEHVEKSEFELVVRSEDGARVEGRRVGGGAGTFNPNNGTLNWAG